MSTGWNSDVSILMMEYLNHLGKTDSHFPCPCSPRTAPLRQSACEAMGSPSLHAAGLSYLGSFTFWIPGMVNSSKTGDKLDALPANRHMRRELGHTLHLEGTPKPWTGSCGYFTLGKLHSYAVMSCWGSTPSRTFFFILFNSSATHDECPTPSLGMREPS